MNSRRRCAGIDWATEHHRVCVLEDDGRIVCEREFSNDEEGLTGLCALLVEEGVERIAIERPDGLLVERLLEAAVVVLPIHPNQVKAARPRFRASGGKSDGFDAFVLAELARTDYHRFRALAPDSEQTRALRALTRAREDLVGARVALANQLRAELEAFWPGSAAIFGAVDSPIALAFLERYPTPTDARTLGEKRLAGFLARNGYCGQKKVSELLATLREAPRARVGEAESEAHKMIVLSLVATLKPLVERIKLLSKEIARRVCAHPDGEIFLSLFSNATLTGARLLSEIGDHRSCYPTNEVLAADCGMSPVAVESGKHRVAAFRRASNKRLRDAVATLADTSRHHNPWARDIYQRARARGCRHPHAIRILGRAWVRVLWRMWQDRMPYDPTRHGGLVRLKSSGGLTQGV